jgi:hypothetical protein
VENALLVGGVDGPGEDFHEGGRGARRLGGAGQVPVEAAAGGKLHRQEGAAAVLAEVVDLEQVGVLQGGGEPGLLREAGAPLRVALA